MCSYGAGTEGRGRAKHAADELCLRSISLTCSYGAGTETSGRVEISFRKESVEGRHVLLVGGRGGGLYCW